MRLPALWQLALYECKGAALWCLVNVCARAHMNGSVVEDGLSAQYLGQSARLRCHDYDSFAAVQGFAAILDKSPQAASIRIGAAKSGHQMFSAALLVGVKLALAGREDIREAQLTALLQAWLQFIPADIRIPSAAGILPSALAAFFHFASLRIAL